MEPEVVTGLDYLGKVGGKSKKMFFEHRTPIQRRIDVLVEELHNYPEGGSWEYNYLARYLDRPEMLTFHIATLAAVIIFIQKIRMTESLDPEKHFTGKYIDMYIPKIAPISYDTSKVDDLIRQRIYASFYRYTYFLYNIELFS